METVSVFVPIPKVTKLELAFDDEVYLAGESINGKVILELNESLFLYSVKLKVAGKGFVEWIGESDENLDYSRKIHCSNKEDYFHHIFTLWGAVLKTCAPEVATPLAKLFQYTCNTDIDRTKCKIAQECHVHKKQNKSNPAKYRSISLLIIISKLLEDHDAEGLEQVLHAGPHIFHFSYKLDDALPSSFKGSHGRIRYYVRAFCTATEGTLAQVEKDVNVQETFNLNLDPSNKVSTSCEGFWDCSVSDAICTLCLQFPLILAAEKDISYWCWNFPGIAVSVTVDKSGFVPGEDIIITSEINNRTSRNLRLISYSVGTEIKYKAFVQEAFCDHYREFIEKLELKKVQAVIEAPPRQVTKILGSLQLPKPMFISDMSRCKIISMSYELQVTIPIPGHRVMVTASAPIKIGTTPIHFPL
uniref:arrestin domain-containing protein 5-like n=1 Tax=Pristiophorus japonicus TaxID=55135 RepID=UPI00398EBBD3